MKFFYKIASFYIFLLILYVSSTFFDSKQFCSKLKSKSLKSQSQNVFIVEYHKFNFLHI